MMLLHVKIKIYKECLNMTAEILIFQLIID